MNVQLLQVKFSTFHLRNAYILSKWTMSSQIMVILIPCNCDWSHHLKRHGACQVDYKAPNQHDYNYYKLVWFSHNKQFPHSLSHTIVFYLSLANPVIRMITVLRPLVPNEPKILSTAASNIRCKSIRSFCQKWGFFPLHIIRGWARAGDVRAGKFKSSKHFPLALVESFVLSIYLQQNIMWKSPCWFAYNLRLAYRDYTRLAYRLKLKGVLRTPNL